MFPMTAEVSVVIPTFNRWPMLAEAVASVIAQGGVDFELIIVDDGSTDETAARLPELTGARLRHCHPERSAPGGTKWSRANESARCATTKGSTRSD